MVGGLRKGATGDRLFREELGRDSGVTDLPETARFPGLEFLVLQREDGNDLEGPKRTSCTFS